MTANPLDASAATLLQAFATNAEKLANMLQISCDQAKLPLRVSQDYIVTGPRDIPDGFNSTIVDRSDWLNTPAAPENTLSCEILFSFNANAANVNPAPNGPTHRVPTDPVVKICLDATGRHSGTITVYPYFGRINHGGNTSQLLRGHPLLKLRCKEHHFGPFAYGPLHPELLLEQADTFQQVVVKHLRRQGLIPTP